MTKKDLMLIASRAISLYLIFWALDNLSYLPLDMFSLSHYSPQLNLPGQDYLYKYHLLFVSHRLAVTALFFIGAIWVYRCGPAVERFLSPTATE